MLVSIELKTVSNKRSLKTFPKLKTNPWKVEVSLVGVSKQENKETRNQNMGKKHAQKNLTT